MSKHTPGPWKYTKCPCGHKSCSQFYISNQGSTGFEEDDARLICAAPELLEALKKIIAIEDLERCGDWEEIEQAREKAREIANAAIKKAEGT